MNLQGRTIPAWATAALLISLAGCAKEPGEGGKAEIQGRVFVKEVNKDTGLPTGIEYYAPEYRVYLIYGDHETFDDDTRTGPDGRYKFPWLRKGDYTVFAYSECPDDCESGVRPIYAHISIENKSEVYEVPDIIVEDWK
ncbi:MAG: hypothetical protein H6597_07350 [Flavobacteriales bacterium]|nr:hypothetical protein [Flavobacteriales bacterium]MCB9194335.1 hypothetical protein [Flavobacteriales bacterium]